MTNKTVCMPSTFPVACHTDHVGIGSTFVAIQGMKSNGVTHIVTALHKGATKIVVAADAVLSNEIIQKIQKASAELMRVENTRMALAQLSAQAAGNPAGQLKLIAITGTKGKTTSSFLLTHMLECAGYNVALLSTVSNRINGVILPASLTTAQPDYLHQFFKLCVEHKVTHVVMEVAAQAVTLHRVHGLVYDALLFTNFSQEHGEFYTNMADYFAAKTSLFAQRAAGAPALVNTDDLSCRSLLSQYDNCLGMRMQEPSTTEKPSSFADDSTTCASNTQQLTNARSAKEYSLKATDNNWPLDSGNAERHRQPSETAVISADIIGTFITNKTGTVQGTVTCRGTEYPVACPALVGDFNAYNSMGVVGIAHFLAITPDQIQQGFLTFAGVPGRLAHYPLPNGASCYIDYAHNPSSYQAVLSTLRTLTDHLIVIFGAGGERDKAKRPIMGAIAAEYASLVVVTSDNPRTEQPEQIIEDICAGIPEEKQHTVIRELDREQAIKKAYNLSHPGSVLVLLGKGTDEYQIVGTTKTFFSEAAIVQSL